MPSVAPPSDATIQSAVALLHSGGVVVMPTETVYGLAGDTCNPAALEQIYQLKGRPADNPLIAHVHGIDGARRVSEGWDARCDALAERCWPGPLTMVLRRAAHVPPAASGGRDTIAVRAPDHPVARRVLAAFGGPLSAPSANRSGRVSPTTAAHVVEDYADVPEAADLVVLDGGACAIGIESTVIDMTCTPARLLRPGGVSVDTLNAVIGDVDVSRVLAQSASPGTAARHYAPRTPAHWVEREALPAACANAAAPLAVIGVAIDAVPSPHLMFVLPGDPVECARVLYDRLREADAASTSGLLIVAPPAGSAWDAIRDRLQRASSGCVTTTTSARGTS